MRATAIPQKRYSKISYEKRMALIQLVDQKNCSILKASKRFNIKHSTAKLIVQIFRREGRVFESKSDKTKRIQKQMEEEADEGQQEERVEEEEPVQDQNDAHPSQNNELVNYMMPNELSNHSMLPWPYAFSDSIPFFYFPFYRI